MGLAVVATLALQWLGAVVNLTLGILAVRIAAGGDASVRPIQLAGWSVVGTALVMAGTVDVIQTSTAVLAVILGPGTVVYEQFIRWSLAMNQSRTGAEIAMGLLLIWIARRGFRSPRVAAATPWILATGLALGAVSGIRSDGSVFADYTAMVVSHTFELTVLGAALVLALVRSSLDWMLWTIVAIKMLSQAINVLILTPMARFGVEGGWYVAPWALQLYLLVIVAAMLGLALWRLARSRRGEAVPALLDRFRERDDRSMALPRRAAN